MVESAAVVDGEGDEAVVALDVVGVMRGMLLGR